jgi:hypothetical protein
MPRRGSIAPSSAGVDSSISFFLGVRRFLTDRTKNTFERTKKQEKSLSDWFIPNSRSDRPSSVHGLATCHIATTAKAGFPRAPRVFSGKAVQVYSQSETP